MTSTLNHYTFTELQRHYVPVINDYLRKSIEQCTDSRQVVTDAVTHSLFAGGKRVRPLLALSSAHLLDIPVEAIIPFSCAIEMAHTYSLIHDDLPAMDDDDLRRGKPTCHIAFGEDIAILAGDLLQTMTFELLSKENTHFSAQNHLKCIHYVAQALGNRGMIGGQVLDIKHAATSFTLEKLEDIHHRKTGALIELSLVGPALLTSQSEDVIQSLKNYGRHLGLLFQITDDILDETGNIEELGKSIGKDRDQEKLTYLTFLGLDEAKEKAKSEAKQANLAIKTLQTPYETLLTSLTDYILNRSF